MKLVSFEAKNLNHLDDLNIRFESDVTFLTGVNGSGKTAILRSINALLAPNLEALAVLSYEKIAITFEFDGGKRTLSASKIENEISLNLTGVDSPFVFSVFERGVYRYADEDSVADYYRSLLSQSSDSESVLEFLSELPSPMYLGLDRRHAGTIGRTRRAVRTDPRRRKRNVFSSPLGDSLKQAVALAEDRFADVRYKTSELDIAFNRDLLLSLLELPQSDPFEIKPPTEKDRKLVDSARKALRSFPRVEGLSADDIRAKIDPTLANIGEIVSKIPKDFDLSKIKDEDPKSIEAFNHVLQWIRMKPLLFQVTKVADLVNAYNDGIRNAREHINQYTRLIDDFYNQTGKTLGFSPNGSIQVQKGKDRFGVDELSSGEAQIFVILTHLAFNPYAQEAGVFIIDEPELSLHLFWQDMLVDNMMQANSGIQYIMATHSPAIIGERVAKARELTPLV